jgi:serine/threonine protein kinase
MIGKTISHYSIIEKIGGGGMGVVYKAQDLNLDRFVALKFLPPHLTTSEEEKQRFIHEAKAASSLDHNNICAVYEIDESEDGQLFISMACYEGDTLDKKIKDKPLPIEDAIDITIQIAQGLTKAHEKEIVHRDIKPANIMLTDDGVVKILDFGLAKLSTQTKLTKESTTLGTVSYISPEQAKGEEVDYRTDIWSLAIILYEMLTGQLPFKGEYESAVIYSILNDTQEPITGLRTGVPMELERIIKKCLQKNPAERYQHIDELIVDLGGLKSESTGIRSMEVKQKKLSKTVLIPITILSILILIVGGYFLIQPGEMSESEWKNSIAVLPFENISNDSEQEYFCDGMTEQIISNLAKLPKLKVISRTSVMKYKATDKTIPEIGKELNVAHVLEGSVRKFGDRIRVTAQLIGTEDDFHIWTEYYDREYNKLFDVQDDISEKIATNLLTTLSQEDKKEVKTNRPSNTEAYEYYMKGRYFHDKKYWKSENLEDFKSSEKMFKRAIELDPNYADSYASLADLYNTYYNSLADTNSEKDKYMQLQEAYIDTAMRLNANSSEVYMAKGWVQYSKDEIEDAIRSVKEAIKINKNDDRIYHALGSMLGDRGLKKIKIKCYSRAIEINPLEAAYYVQRAYDYTRIGEYDKAEIDLQKAIEIEPSFWWALLEYSIVLIQKKRYDQAKQMIKRLNEFSPGEEINRMFEAVLYAVNGEKDKALSVNISEKYIKYYIYRLLEMSDETIQYLNEDFDRVKNAKSTWYLGLKYWPIYDFLRPDPRFQEILAKHRELYEENLRK